jgi:transposase
MISIIDHTDRVVKEKRLANDLTAIDAYLLPCKADLMGVVVESTFNWYWLVDGLLERGYPVSLANTCAIKQYQGLKYLNDAIDAQHLAQLLRLGILPTGYIYPQPMRAVRDLLRRRLLLIKHRTAQLLSVQGLLGRYSGARLSAERIKRLTDDELKDYLDQPATMVAARQHFTTMAQLSTHIRQIEQFVLPRCDACTYQLLTSVPGIGPILGMTIALETGPIERFARVERYTSYARCAPTRWESNGKLKGKGNARNGNRYLGMAFMQAGHYASIHHPTIKRYYQRKSQKRPLMVAKKAVANKLTRAVYYMLTRRERFKLELAFG